MFLYISANWLWSQPHQCRYCILTRYFFTFIICHPHKATRKSIFHQWKRKLFEEAKKLVSVVSHWLVLAFWKQWLMIASLHRCCHIFPCSSNIKKPIFYHIFMFILSDHSTFIDWGSRCRCPEVTVSKKHLRSSIKWLFSACGGVGKQEQKDVSVTTSNNITFKILVYYRTFKNPSEDHEVWAEPCFKCIHISVDMAYRLPLYSMENNIHRVG